MLLYSSIFIYVFFKLFNIKKIVYINIIVFKLFLISYSIIFTF